MTINYRRAEGSVVCTYIEEPKALMFLTQNVSMIANPILKKLHVLGFTQVQRPVDSPQVAGRISQFATNWKAITEDQWILRTVQGFHIPFREEPCQMRLPRPYYSEEQMKLLREEVASLLGKGAVQVVDPTLSAEGFYSALFLVPKTEGRMRPVINLKALNFWVQPQHFKMEGIHTLREIVAEGEWLAKLDLKDAYFTVPIFRDHQKYLRFCSGQNSIPVYVSPVRSILCTLGFYQGLKTSGRFPKKLRNSPYHLYRRYTGNREIPGRSSGSRGSIDCSIGGLGLHSEHGEVCNDSIPAN